MDREKLIEFLEWGEFNCLEHEISDDLVAEFFDHLPIPFMFMNGILSKRTVSEFEDDLRYRFGNFMFENFHPINDHLKKQGADTFFRISDETREIFTIGIETVNYCFNLSFDKNKSLPRLMAAHQVNRGFSFVQVQEHTGKGIISSINTFLFDNIK